MPMHMQLWIDLRTGKISTVKPSMENRHVHILNLSHTFDAALIVNQLQAIADASGNAVSEDVIRLTIEIPEY